MTVAFDAVGPSSAGFSSGTALTTYTWSHTVGAAANNCIIVCITLDNEANTDTATVKYGTTTLTLLDGPTQSGGGTGSGGYQAVYGAAGVATGTNTVTVTVTTGPQDITAGSISFTGVDQTTPFGTVASTTSSKSVTVPSTTSGNYVVSFMSAGNTITLPTGPTQAWLDNFQGGAGASTGNDAGVYEASTGSSMTITWATTSTVWVIDAFEVQATGGIVSASATGLTGLSPDVPVAGAAAIGPGPNLTIVAFDL